MEIVTSCSRNNIIHVTQWQDNFVATIAWTTYGMKPIKKRSYVQKNEGAKNGEMAKDRITVPLVASISDEKLRALVIEKRQNPRFFLQLSLSRMQFKYEANKKA
ncbi:unnamed protein product [Lepeophtheirus salmonis]|uniref:(salmon louse) hypothetical protein n=1 Tax=Lepeophtheirus salmonis TaxID=72036 RepID=A0A7R8H7L1_LEPSM|nr:unnamed protein product [Lepeophtheirus salmonis]CAF2912610.1 unnamed protein product [Lepeophtheirus salmonis]